VTAPAVVIQTDLTMLELHDSQPVIYDRPIGIRQVYKDPVSGDEHYVIRYPPDLRARRHSHTVAHTVIVLDGVMEANAHRVPAGSYAHFEAGTVTPAGP
jgi:quercetin dioxygenase-like cupin family protein